MKHDTSGRRLYHFQLCIPRLYQRPVFEGALTYSRHALLEAESDRYGEVSLPERFAARGAKLIEVEAVDGVVVKQLWRQKLDETRDLVLAITPAGTIKTVWVNEIKDTHRTLDPRIYEYSHLAKLIKRR
jgi:hypothetical protein